MKKTVLFTNTLISMIWGLYIFGGLLQIKSEKTFVLFVHKDVKTRGRLQIIEFQIVSMTGTEPPEKQSQGAHKITIVYTSFYGFS